MNPLTDLLPPKARAVLYAIVSVAAFVYGLFQAFHGDWAQVIPAVVAALTGALAGSNVKTEPKPAVVYLPGSDTPIRPGPDGIATLPSDTGKHEAD